MPWFEVPEGSCGCPIPAGVQDQAGWDFEQSELVVSRSTARGMELDGL